MLRLTTLQWKPCPYVQEITNARIWTKIQILFLPSQVYHIWLHGLKQAKSLFFPIFTVYKVQTPYFTVTSFFFPWGNPCILTRRFHLAALNSGSQPLSCSIMVFSFNQLPWPHPRSSAWGPDEIRSPCPALRFIFLHNYNFFLSDQNNSMSMQNHGQIDQPIHKCYFQFCS